MVVEVAFLADRARSAILICTGDRELPVAADRDVPQDEAHQRTRDRGRRRGQPSAPPTTTQAAPRSAANERTSTPNRSSCLRTPRVAPLIANAKVPVNSSASTTDAAIGPHPHEQPPPSYMHGG